MAATINVGERYLAEHFDQVVQCDFEFRHDRGERPWPVCMVARELRGDRVIRLWRDDLLGLDRAPFDTGPRTLFTAYAAAAAEIGCFHALGWKQPERIVDLYFEHCVQTNGAPAPHGNGLLGALAHRGLPHMDYATKENMRELVITRREWSAAERQAILEYCGVDVEALAALFAAIVPAIDFPRALLRGRFAQSAARIEANGVPIDTDSYRRLRDHWYPIKSALIDAVDQDYRVYDNGIFRQDVFARYLATNGIPWPRTSTGRLATDDDTFRTQARLWPALMPLRELRATQAAMRSFELPIGGDGRSRCSLMPFRSITGRNQPRVSEFVFALPKWARGLIKPPAGYGIAYIDWVAQEIALAAALSDDDAMLNHYRSGDPYLAFGKTARLAPPDATAESHPLVRARCKALLIGVNYGMSSDSIATDAAVSRAEANELLRQHRASYRSFWRWNEHVIDEATITGTMTTVFGWQRRIGPHANARSIGNWPMQANGAEMMRVAAIGATEAGIEVCAPVHDAFLIAAPLDRLDEDVARMRQIMTKAGNVVTGGLDIATTGNVVRWPNRYMPDGAGEMWARVMRLLQQVEAAR